MVFASNTRAKAAPARSVSFSLKKKRERNKKREEEDQEKRFIRIIMVLHVCEKGEISSLAQMSDSEP